MYKLIERYTRIFQVSTDFFLRENLTMLQKCALLEVHHNSLNPNPDIDFWRDPDSMNLDPKLWP